MVHGHTVLAGELAGAEWGCRQAGGVRVGERKVSAGGLSAGRGGYWDASGMVIIPSIDREAAHDNGREFINFPVNLIHCNFLPLFN